MVINTSEKVSKEFIAIVSNPRSKLGHSVVQRFFEFVIKMINHVFNFDFCHLPSHLLNEFYSLKRWKFPRENNALPE